MFFIQKTTNRGAVIKLHLSNLRRCRCISTEIFKGQLSLNLIKELEEYWSKRCQLNASFDFKDDSKAKFYSLSMFPYPSGNLHMGHVRVYTLSDVIARYKRFNGKNVFHPIGWDAFGLPAENAAIERGIHPDKWTKQNIAHMKEQLKQLHFTFDWQVELATCSPDYYKWTQYLFLKMYDAGLVYQKESLVNWDPVDCTVLADEQVDSAGQSWRSGAKVEKRLLKQWFIRTTKFSQSLLNGLNSETLLNWFDIIDVQRNWIGECNGYSFDLKIKIADCISDTNCLNVWVRDPTLISEATFIMVRPDSLVDIIAKGIRDVNGKLGIEAVNPFTNHCLPIFVSEDAPYPFARDVYVGAPSQSDFDRAFVERVNLTSSDSHTSYTKQEICEMARQLRIGGYPVSSQIQDWLISRQRYWGTPIPVLHCEKCGALPVSYDDLPVELPPVPENVDVGITLNNFLKTSEWKNTVCPKCGGSASRETDTMDTFVDSSWYYLRYTDVNNRYEPFNKDIVNKLLPVDLYVGGKEHAMLHLYYARFFAHFLHSIGMIEHREPFRRLLCQGMVKGRTYKTKAGKYLKPDEVHIEGETAKSMKTGEVLDVVFEKMSKSKYNGVDPKEILHKYGVDTTRLFLLFSASPWSHRQWDEKLFHDVTLWQSRLWLIIREFIEVRKKNVDDMSPTFNLKKQNASFWDIRNFSVSKVTFSYHISQNLAVGISHLQKLSSALRKTSPETKKYCEEYEKSLAALIIMLYPIIPHFAATLWFGFTSAPGRLTLNEAIINWKENVFVQSWPCVDADFEVPVHCHLNGKWNYKATVPSGKLSSLTAEQVLEYARRNTTIENIYSKTNIVQLKLKTYRNLCAELVITGELERSDVERHKK